MKFSVVIKSNIVNEWEENYLCYVELKSLMVEDKEEFKKRIEDELRKVNNFFFILESQAVAEKDNMFSEEKGVPKSGFSAPKSGFVTQRESTTSNKTVGNKRVCDTDGIIEEEDNIVKEQSDGMQSDCEDDNRNGSYSGNPHSGNNSFIAEIIKKNRFKIPGPFERRRREKNFHEFLHAINSIKRFREINYTGLLKLTKKYRRIYSEDTFHSSFLNNIDSSYFHKSKRIDLIHKAVKDMYKNEIAKDENKAKSIFRKIGRKTKPDPISSFFSGVLITSSLLMWYFLDLSSVKMVGYSMALIYYGSLLFGFDIFVFKKYRINYKYIFNFDMYSSFHSIRYILFISFLMTFNFVGCFLSSKIEKLNISVFLVMQVFLIFMPFKILFYNSRIYFISLLFRILVLPFSNVRFRHFFLADVCQSFTFCIKKILLGLEFKCGFVSTMCINIAFPIIRMIQSFRRYKDTDLFYPHIVNAMKYSFVIIAGISAALYEFDNNRSKWIFKMFVTFLSSLFSFFWDVFVDWGINREKKLCPSSTYLIAVVFNFITRFLWIVKENREVDEYLMCFLEITRRFIWTIFRVEIEHLNNCREIKSGKFLLLTSGELYYKKDFKVEVETETENDESTTI